MNIDLIRLAGSPRSVFGNCCKVLNWVSNTKPLMLMVTLSHNSCLCSNGSNLAPGIRVPLGPPDNTKSDPCIGRPSSLRPISPSSWVTFGRDLHKHIINTIITNTNTSNRSAGISTHATVIYNFTAKVILQLLNIITKTEIIANEVILSNIDLKKELFFTREHKSQIIYLKKMFS
jgi:hypothetical protein